METKYLIIGAVILFLLFAGCLIIGGTLFYLSEQKGHLPSIEVPQPEPPGSNAAANITIENNSKADAQWVKITGAKVEAVCLKQAKDYAVKQGFSASFVFSCKCGATERENTKSYDCVVSTANVFDPNKEVKIYCSKSLRSCTIGAEGATQTFTFDQLEQAEK